MINVTVMQPSGSCPFSLKSEGFEVFTILHLEASTISIGILSEMMNCRIEETEQEKVTYEKLHLL